MKPIKSLIKKIIYKLGILSLYHNIRNKNALTVVVFHRVLSEDDYRWSQADKEWTVSNVFFTEVLVFFKKHYSIVSLEEVILGQKGEYKLPDKPVLITFDDGWKDNYEYAFPIINHYNVPITIFCTTGSINARSLNWREVLSALILLNKKNAVYIVNILSKYNIDCSINLTHSEFINLISSSADIADITPEIDELAHFLGEGNQMLQGQEIIDMYKSGLVSFGGHGRIHEPMHLLPNYHNDLLTSRKTLSELLNVEINSMAYPHSSVSQDIYEAAADVGYTYQFGGRNSLNIVGSPTGTQYFGRVGINQLELSENNKKLSPELLSLALFKIKHKQSIY